MRRAGIPKLIPELFALLFVLLAAGGILFVIVFFLGKVCFS